MTKKLDNKVALITGGTTGIGLATAELFIEQGAHVIVTGNNPDNVSKAKNQLEGRAEVIQSNASNTDDIAALFAHVEKKHGRLDVLFLNAGIAKFSPLADAPLEDFDQMWNVNVRGPFAALQKAIPLLKEGSSVVFTTSVVDAKGFPNTSAYAATKAALRSVVRVAAVELAPRGIRVNAVSPGPIDTPIYGKLGLAPEEVAGFADSMRSKIPVQRFGTADEVARAALFLASSDASFITGTELDVDGGLAQG